MAAHAAALYALLIWSGVLFLRFFLAASCCGRGLARVTADWH
jgi:hypothetical protein